MNNDNMSKNSVVGSLIWKLLERGGIQIIQFVVSIIIARLLDPAAYGSVALITVFVSLATVFVQSGLGTALVQKKDADSTDFSSVFYYSLTIAAFIYAVLFFTAGPIAQFYKMPDLKPVLRVMALTLFPGAFNSIQVAVLSRKMQFKLQFYSGLLAAVISGAVGITLAATSFGVWALVAQQLSYQVLICILLWFMVKWRPTLEFSFAKTKGLLKFGSKLLFSNLIDTLYHNIESLIIGKKHSESDLAFFSKGKQFPLILIDNINGSVQSVMFAAYSKEQDNLAKIKNMLRKTMAMNTYLVFPAMLGLAVVGKPLILLVLGEKWLDCVVYLQVYCLLSMLMPMQTANLQAINALGRSDVYVKIMIVKRLLGVALIFGAVFLFESPVAIAYAALINEFISLLINIIPNKKIIGYSAWELIKDTLPNLILAVIMAAAAVLAGYFIENPVLKILAQMSAGVVSYLLVSIISGNKNFKYLKDLVIPKIFKK